MKTNSVSLSVLGILVIAAFLVVVGTLEIQQAYAQSDGTSTESVVSSSDSVAPVDQSTDTPNDSEPAVPATESTSTNSEVNAPVDNSPITEATAPLQSLGLVEVQLDCTQSYTTDLYDTPSGRLDPYVKPETATTSDTIAHVIGKQSHTVCHDARGNVHEFPITADEYAALAVRGTPQKSVMEPADQAALDSFEDASAPVSDATSSSETSSTVLDVSTSTSDVPSDSLSAPTTSASTTSSDTTSTPTTTADSAATATPTTTPEDSTTRPVTNDNRSDSSLAPADATATDTPPI
jgi:hypothetical protein